MKDQEFLTQIHQLDGILNKVALRFVKNEQDALDLKQDTLFKAYKYRRSFKEGTNFNAWVTTIMRNCYINAFHKNKARKNIRNSAELNPEIHGNHLHQQNEGANRLRYNDVFCHLENLSEPFSTTFLMFVKGYSYQEIADLMDIPIGTLKSRIFTARVQLKRAIAQADAYHCP